MVRNTALVDAMGNEIKGLTIDLITTVPAGSNGRKITNLFVELDAEGKNPKLRIEYEE